MMAIRRADPSDRNAVELVYAGATGSQLSLCDKEWERWISLAALVVAEIDNRVVGFGSIDVTATEHLRWLYLLPEYQRAGLGSRILQALEEIAWLNGLKAIRLHSTPNAVQFYAKLGYHRVPIHHQFGHDHDGVEMVKARPDNVF
jgi:GNAT superfamily N-acetyltransferase